MSCLIEVNAPVAEAERLCTILAGFTCDIIIYQNDNEAGDIATISIIEGHASFASTVGSIKKFREQIERLFPAPEGCRWSFNLLTAQIVRNA